MSIPSSGQLTLQMIANEFGGSVPHSLSEYYRNGGRVPGNNTTVPESGAISFSNFYGTTNAITYTASNSGSRLIASSLFGANWGSSIPKRLLIPAGVILGSTDVNQEALQIDGSMGGTLDIVVEGSVQGAGAPSGGAVGGNAINVLTPNVAIIVSGSILAGGGGGGQGGQGGQGGGGVVIIRYLTEE